MSRSVLATASMVLTASSWSGGVQILPLSLMNTTIETNAVRLFPSGSGWLFARCQPNTAALSIRSG